ILALAPSAESGHTETRSSPVHSVRPDESDDASSHMSTETIAIVSGRLDSVTLAYWLQGQGRDLRLLSFDYGQRLTKEIPFARECAQRLGARHDLVDLTSVGPLLSGSALTDDIAIPDGYYAEDSMRITVVPNRNAIMLAIAFGVAVA